MKRIFALFFCLSTLVVNHEILLAEKSKVSSFDRSFDSNKMHSNDGNTEINMLNPVTIASLNYMNPVVYVCPDQVVGYLPPNCDCDGKIIEMTVIYDGPNNATISVGPNSSGSNPYINTNTQSGDTLVINLGSIGNDWYYLVNGIQDANIHASCSDDILNNVNASKSDFGHLGSYPNPDQNSNDGTFLVIGFMDDNGNICPAGGVNGTIGGATAIISSFPDSGLAPYSFSWSNGETTQNISVHLNTNTTYTVTVTDANGLTASANHSVTVVDVSCPGYPDKVLMCDNGSLKCEKKSYLCQKLADGYTLGPCGYDFSQPNSCGSVFSLPNCPCICDGKIVEMTVVYDGPAGATVNVGPNSSGSNPYTNTNTQPGDVLVINLGNIGNNWYFLVNGAQDADIHASCSDDILNNINSTKSDFGHLGSYPNPDQNSNDGTFLVIGFKDDNGNVCPSGGIQGPNAVDDNVTLIQGDTVGIQVLINDTDPNNNINVSSLTVLSGPSNGSVSVNTSTGIVTYIPNVNFNGSDSFTYLICNNIPVCDTATVHITVNPPVNLPPNAVDDSVSTTQGIPVTIDVQLNDTDPDGDPLVTIAIISGPINGVTTIVNGDSIIYTPNPTFIGIETFMYIISDGNGGSDTAIVTIDVGTITPPPMAVDDNVTTNQNTSVAISVLTNDIFPPNTFIDSSSLAVISGPFNGGISVNTSTGLVTYIPVNNFIGVDSFIYVICNTALLCDTATVFITVDTITGSFLPIAVDDNVTTNQNTSVGISVLNNDIFPPNTFVDSSSLAVISGPFNGGISVNTSTGIVTYVPINNFTGVDSFIYVICNTVLLCDTATVYITVDSIISPPLPPIAVDDNVNTNQNTTIAISVLNNDIFPPNTFIDSSSLAVISGPFNGGISVNTSTGIVTYIPGNNFTGVDSFIYVICNTVLLCDTATVFITVDTITGSFLPIAVDDNATTIQNTSVAISVLNNDIFPPNTFIDSSSLAVISGPFNGSTSVNTSTGIVTYIPNISFIGIDSFAYVICNTIFLCDTATVYITVDSIISPPLPPIAVDDNVNTNQNTTIAISVLNNDIFPPNTFIDSSSLAVISGPFNGTTSVNTSTGIVTYIPSISFIGIDSFTYVICNTILLCDTATVYITVDSIISPPLPPIAVDDNVNTNQNTTIAISVLNNDIFPPNTFIDSSSLAVISGPFNGTTSVNTSTGIVTYIPSISFIGIDSFTYVICNTILLCDTATVYITVDSIISPPLPPIAVDDNVNTNQNTTIAISVLNNDIFPPNTFIDSSSLAVISGPFNGTTSVNTSTGIVTYTPNISFIGIDSFAYVICNTILLCDTATVYISVNGPCPIANAGPDQNLCNVTTTTLAGSTLDPGNLGNWSVISGTAIVSNPGSPTSAVIGLTTGSSVLVWTVTTSSGTCTPSSDTMMIDLNTSTTVTTADAGPDQILCNVTSTTLAANSVATCESGFWSIISGTAVVVNPTSPTSGVIGLTLGATSQFIWTITGPGGNFSSDTMLITVNAIANAGPIQNLCNTSTSTVSAVTPGPSESGIWTVLSGTAIVTNPPSATSGVTNLITGTSSTLIWTITGICGTSSDNVVINVGTSSIANAGADKNLCDSTSATLSGNLPAVGDTGIWSVINGSAIVTNPNSPTSDVTNLTIGSSSTLIWTITGPCGSDSDTLLINVQSSSSITQANAGPDQIICNLSTTLLAANTPGLLESGSWTVINGTAQVTSASSSTSGVTGLTTGASSTLVWTVTGICGVSTDTMFITVNAIANAGPDQNLCNTSTSTLSASAPGPSENGIWTVLSGTAIVTNPTSPTSGVTNLTIGASSTLIWTITGVCGTSSNNLIINVGTATIANAGSDMNLCDSTSATISGNMPAAGDTGVWSVINGPATVTNPNSPISGVTNLTIGLSSTLVWTISGPCGSNSDTLVINVQSSASITLANAGPDQDLCDTITTTSLNANAPGLGENGNWTVIAGSAIVTDPSSPSSGVTGILGSSTLVWTISNFCGSSSDTLFLNVTTGGNCCVNIPLTAFDDAANLDEDTSLVIPVLLNDYDPETQIDASSLKVIIPPTKGNYTVNTTTGTVTYLPEINYFGVDSFTYVVCDTGCLVVNCDTAIVRILVNSVNDCPIALDDSAFTKQNTIVDINVALNDTFDIDGNVDVTTVSIIDFPSNGTATVNSSSGSITYEPFFGFLGLDTLVYEICDDGDSICCVTATVYIKVGDCDLCIPNSLSPNGDLICDVLEINCIENYPNNELKIFNRWGNCVYKMKAYDNTWDGTSNTGPVLYGNELHDGTYFYVFDKGDGSKPENGFLVLKRN